MSVRRVARARAWARAAKPATVLDFGIIGRIDRQTSLGYTRFMMAIAMNDGVAAGRAGVEAGTLTSRSDVAGFLSDMQRYIPTVANQTLERSEFGNSFNQVIGYYTNRGIAVNPRIALFGKASANMEGSLRRLAPELDTFEVFRDMMGTVLRQTKNSRKAQSSSASPTRPTAPPARSPSRCATSRTPSSTGSSCCASGTTPPWSARPGRTPTPGPCAAH
jgi:predicted unusual protein kinase regulating ubiquinone biosynthesis (AarF/ABC1/UbiB family)